MQVELLYFEGCPNWRAEFDELRNVLDELGCEEPVGLIEVRSAEDAQRLRFVGSPTVRVDGRDVDPDAPDAGFNLECRIYWVNGQAKGRPPREWVAAALRDAKGNAGRQKGDR